MERTHAARAWFVSIWLIAALWTRPALPADRIILRNLDILSDRTVIEFDEDGVRLDDRRTIGWDEIEAARVAADRQAEFDRYLSDLGTHLYRIRQRLRIGDYRDLLPHAEALYPRYRERQSAAAYMVTQALMWGRLASGSPAAALEPYLKCYTMLRQQPDLAQGLPGERRLRFDAATGLTPELPPVWFDGAAVEREMESVFRAIARLPRPRPEGAYIYYASMALTVGQPDQAERVLQVVSARQTSLAELRLILGAQRETLAGNPGTDTATLEKQWRSFTPANQPLALYWLGSAKTAAADKPTQQQGMLHLLQIPAVYGEQHPELAGAALYEAMEALSVVDDSRGAVAVRNELLARYGQTWHARQTREPAAN